MPHVKFGNFSLEVSSAWTLSTVILAGPPEEDLASPQLLTVKTPRSFQQNIIVTMEKVSADETPQSYVKKQLEGLRKAGVTRQEAAPAESVSLDSGLDGFLTEQVMVGPGGEWVRQMQLVSIKDGVAHTIIASHLEGPPFEKARAQFRAMLLSFR